MGSGEEDLQVSVTIGNRQLSNGKEEGLYSFSVVAKANHYEGSSVKQHTSIPLRSLCQVGFIESPFRSPRLRGLLAEPCTWQFTTCRLLSYRLLSSPKKLL